MHLELKCLSNQYATVMLYSTVPKEEIRFCKENLWKIQYPITIQSITCKKKVLIQIIPKIPKTLLTPHESEIIYTIEDC